MLTIILGKARLKASKDMTTMIVARITMPPTHHLEATAGVVPVSAG
jgi:hypothetical protein